MAFATGNQTRLISGPFALSSHATQVAASSSFATLERTPMTSTAPGFILGKESHTLTVTSMMDSDTTAGGYWASVKGAFEAGTLLPVSVAPIGFDAGNSILLAEAYTAMLGIGSDVDSAVDVPITYAVTGDAAYGQSLVNHAAVTATTTGSAIDGAAASTNGGIAHLHVTAASGTTPTCDVTIEHSVNGSTSWATLATFAQVTTAVASQRVTVAAGTSVRRYLRAVITLTGSGLSYTVAVAFARS